MLLARLEARVKQIATQADALWPQLCLANRIKVDTFRQSKEAGFAYAPFTVTFNLDYLEHYGFEAMDDIFIHEVAHLVMKRLHPNNRQNHGRLFIETCHALGGTGSTKHRFDISISVPAEKMKGIVKVTCICGSAMHFTRGLFAKVKGTPSRFQTKCCGADLDVVLGAAACTDSHD